MKYNEMLKKKSSKDSDGVSTSEKSDQVGVVEEADEDSCDSLQLCQEKIKFRCLVT